MNPKQMSLLLPLCTLAFVTLPNPAHAEMLNSCSATCVRVHDAERTVQSFGLLQQASRYSKGDALAVLVADCEALGGEYLVVKAGYSRTDGGSSSSASATVRAESSSSSSSSTSSPQWANWLNQGGAFGFNNWSSSHSSSSSSSSLNMNFSSSSSSWFSGFDVNLETATVNNACGVEDVDPYAPRRTAGGVILGG